MARITLSSLVSFLVVLLLATTCKAAAQYRISNDNSWAKHFPPGGGQPPFFSSVLVDDNFASIYERWTIERFEDGFRFQNSGTGFFLTARSGEAQGSSEFDPETSKWYIEGAGDGKFKILAPGQDLVVTARRLKAEYPITLFLQPAEGSSAQLWSFERL
ncbi:hypothetical protein K457DRAFT_140856 [Linnemannia elongata AG-77]|uniref:Ricin B lectin domain-containing protein n=1 Tax=Linnemannia elongata AG-77 TaxID=1314771 RepID=A0A197JLR3_9FUNG|nr:hypothetical protein K457DRAFT_140856 [Linnemannia elongata AG-77]